MNGNDLVMLTITSNTAYSFGFGLSPDCPVVYKISANGRPNNIVKNVLTKIMYNVSPVASNTKFNKSSII